MTISELPEAPSRGDSPTDFIAKADAFLAALSTFRNEVNATAAAFGVTKWISGTTYAIDDTVWSPADNLNYRRLTTGAGTTDPSLDPTNWALASAGVLPGTQVDFMGTSVPTGYLACDGSNVSRTSYAALYNAIGTTHGTGNGTTTFTLPDSRRRVSVGAGGTGTGTLGNAVGNTGGEETHIQTLAEMAAHAHTASVTDPGHTHGLSGANNNASGTLTAKTPNNDGSPNATSSATTGITVSVGSTGSGTAANVMQPSIVVKKVIKY